MSIRTLVIAGTIAIGAALSAGTASAAPATDINIPTSSDSGVEQAYYKGGYNYGYNFGQNRLCYVPFYKLAQYYGFWQAKQIKRNCYTPYYSYNGYNKYNGYKSY